LPVDRSSHGATAGVAVQSPGGLEAVGDLAESHNPASHPVTLFWCPIYWWRHIGFAAITSQSFPSDKSLRKDYNL